MTIIVDNFEKKCGKCQKKDKVYYFNWILKIWMCGRCDRIQQKHANKKS